MKSVEYLSKEAQVSLRSAVFSLGKYMYPYFNKPAAQVFTFFLKLDGGIRLSRASWKVGWRVGFSILLEGVTVLRVHWC